MELRDIMANVFVKVKSQAVADHPDRLIPDLEVTSVDLQIPKDKHKIGIHSNVVAKCIDMLKKVFFDKFWDGMVKTVETQTLKNLNDKFDRVLNSLNGYQQLSKNYVLDWSLTKTPTVQNDWVEVGFKGVISKAESEETIPRITPVDLPFHISKSNSTFQVLVSNFVAESLL